jgi:hypothetical protein
MKSRINLTIEHIRAYVAKSYFKTIIAPSRHKNIVDLINNLKKPDIDENIYLKEEFYLQY